MALTLEQLQAQRDRLLSEMSEAQQEQFGDKSITRRPQAELEAALRRVDREISGLSGFNPKQIVIVPKGF